MNNYITPNYIFANITPAKAQGSVVWDEAGKDYIDFLSGIAVTALGHCHPKLIAALQVQANKLWHVSNKFSVNITQELAEKLVNNTFAEKVFFANSGSEANEAALKLARKYAFDNFGSEKNKIVACNDSFHGRTLFTVSTGGQPKYCTGFGPLPPQIFHTPFNDIEALTQILDGNTCAFIVEPIQGESGVLPAHQDFLKAARKLCDQHQIAFILDEVQTGLGRTGTLFAHEQYGVIPDILTSAKALGCGLPIGAMLTTNKFASAFTPGSHGSTFGGNPLICAVASTAFDLINNPDTLNNVKNQHDYFMEELSILAQESGKFELIRGNGLLLGCVLAEQYQNLASDLVAKILETGVLVSQAGPNVIRLAPSLIINDEDRIEGLKRFKSAVQAWKPQL